MGSGHVDIAKCLVEHGANRDKQMESGATPLFSASLRGHTELVQLFCEIKCNVEKAKHSGETPLVTAAEHGHLEVVQLLCEAGAKIHKRTMGSLTALTAAEEHGHHHVEMYLQQKAKENDETEDAGCTWAVFLTLALSVGMVVFFGWLTHIFNKVDKTNKRHLEL